MYTIFFFNFESRIQSQIIIKAIRQTLKNIILFNFSDFILRLLKNHKKKMFLCIIS